MRISDWSSDVCSSDLVVDLVGIALDDGDDAVKVKPRRLVGLQLGAEGGAVVGGDIQRGQGGAAVSSDLDRLVGFLGREDNPVVAVGDLHRRGARAGRRGDGLARADYVRGAHISSEVHTSELQSLMRISSAVLCFK